MPTPTYTLIDSVTLGSSASSVTFSSISATGKGDLVLVVNVQNGVTMQFNGDSGSNYSYVQMSGNGSETKSYTESSQSYLAGGWYTNAGLHRLEIFDYSNTTIHKSCLKRNDKAGAATLAMAGRWGSTAAITSVSTNGSLLAGDTFHLYQLVSE